MSNTKPKISFKAKNSIECPVCDEVFYREELLSGSGRLIADYLTVDLRRLYQESKKYGKINPLIYNITVCPHCYYAAFTKDFEELFDSGIINQISQKEGERKQLLQDVFKNIDFNNERTLKEGAASYILALMCYAYFPDKYHPLFKQALCSLRLAWLFDDLHQENHSENFNTLSLASYKKARFLYSLLLEKETEGLVDLTQVRLGPDTDKDYGYDGLLYLHAFLEFYFGDKEDQELRKKTLEVLKSTLGRLFGMGKGSKEKPGPILDNARNVYEQINAEYKSYS